MKRLTQHASIEAARTYYNHLHEPLGNYDSDQQAKAMGEGKLADWIGARRIMTPEEFAELIDPVAKKNR